MLQGATSNEVDIGSTLLAAATADFQVKSILRRAISQLREKYPATTALVRPVREKLRLPDRREPSFPRPVREGQCERESASEIQGLLRTGSSNWGNKPIRRVFTHAARAWEAK